MELSKYFVNVFKGTLRALIVTLIFVVAVSIVMVSKMLTLKALTVIWVVITCLSIMFGTIYGAKKNGERGWLIGLGVAIIYYLCVLILSAIFKGSLALSMLDLYRFLIALAIGVLSGMLGINI